MNREAFYPLLFTPIYKKRIWGGSMMHDLLARPAQEAGDPVGESWELVDRDGEESLVANGALAGTSIRTLMEHSRNEMLGPRGAQHKQFPLLVKLIDAGERLSLQVHPDAAACKELGDGAEPKTEMWYIIGAGDDGKILAGLNQKATKLRLSEVMDKPEVEELLQQFKSQPGDAYFITSGMLHAIGGGNLILEIQQNSDTTYRISDWGRVDAEGKSRELHVEKGMKSILFTNRTSPKITGVSDIAPYNRKFPLIKQCPFFSVEALHLHAPWQDSTATSGSFHLISAVSGSVQAASEHGVLLLKKGETALIPYCVGNYSITPEDKDIETVVLKTTL